MDDQSVIEMKQKIESMSKVMNNNPLTQYFREVKLSVQLPSQCKYYGTDVVKDTTITGEIRVYGMTSKDELVFNNPDALMNGDAICSVIESCCPDIVDPKKLFTVDVNTLLMAIKKATFGDEYPFEVPCPNCQAESNKLSEEELKLKVDEKKLSIESQKYRASIEYILVNTTYLEGKYQVITSSGLTISLIPHSYEMTNKTLLAQFEQRKILDLLNREDITEEKKQELVEGSLQKIVAINKEAITNAVSSIVTKDGVEVKFKEHIQEFLDNTDLEIINQITDKLTEMNLVGHARSYPCKCKFCEHEWVQTGIQFNPTDFFV